MTIREIIDRNENILIKDLIERVMHRFSTKETLPELLESELRRFLNSFERRLDDCSKD